MKKIFGYIMAAIAGVLALISVYMLMSKAFWISDTQQAQGSLDAKWVLLALPIITLVFLVLAWLFSRKMNYSGAWYKISVVGRIILAIWAIGMLYMKIGSNIYIVALILALVNYILPVIYALEMVAFLVMTRKD